jgi:peptidoglycan/LPS O-acetylase OafA/YrhL
MFGFLAAYLQANAHLFWERHKDTLFYLGVSLIGYIKIHSICFGLPLAYHIYLSFLFTSIGTALLLPKLDSIKVGSGTIYHTVTFVSIISYAMYLLNFTPVATIVIPKLLQLFSMSETNGIRFNFLKYILYWTFTIGGSYMLYRYFEKPVMDLRNKIKW